MRAASKIAPLPMLSLKICPECPVLPSTSSVHELAPRRPTVAVLRIVGSKLRTRSLALAATERARRVERFQGVEQHDGAALHIRRACAVGPVAFAPEFLAAEDGVNVSDQEDPSASRTPGLRGQMPGAFHFGGHLDPPGRQAERLKLLFED